MHLYNFGSKLVRWISLAVAIFCVYRNNANVDASNAAENEVVPLLPMGEEQSGGGGSGGNPFTLNGDASKQKNVLTFRLANRLAVAVCDTYDTYLATGKPFTGQIKYNQTVQDLKSPVPPNTCQSFKVKRCTIVTEAPQPECGWTKVNSC